MDNRYKMTLIATEEELLRDALGKWGISKRALTAIKFDGGFLAVNGMERNVRHPLQMGDVVDIYFPPEEKSEGLVVEYGKLDIVYEDETMLILNKPPYQSTIPSREHPSGSVANDVCGYFEQQALASTVHVVTRLDRNTSGLMCIAKHRHIHHLMGLAQKEGRIKREYEAIVHGHLNGDTQSIIAPIGRKDSSIIEREVREDGQFAHTDVKVLKHMTVQGENLTHVRLKLYTGRTHQIRVHMAHIGHPLVGDELYGGSNGLLNRQALHCVSLSLEHPFTKEVLQFNSEPLVDMQQLINN